MKNNKNSLLSLGLLALVLVLGVGYAVVSSVDLTFGGSASVKDAEIQVDIENVTSTSTGSSAITNTWTSESHAKTDTFTISNMTLNEERTITYTIKNHETDVKALLKTKTALKNDNEEYFEVSYTPTTETTIAADGTTDVVVKVKLIKTPVTSDDGTANISFTLSAEAVDNAS